LSQQQEQEGVRDADQTQKQPAGNRVRSLGLLWHALPIRFHAPV
jgi:hypothetical protein